MAESESFEVDYFTLDLYRALNDWDTVPAALDSLKEANFRYAARQAEIRGSFSAELASAADAWMVNDGLISRLRQTDSPATLELVLRCGDLQVGYFDLDFTYDSPDISDQDLTSLVKVASYARGNRRYGGHDAWVHEIDTLEDGRIEHRIFFQGEVCIAIQCRGIHVVRVEKANRRLQPFPNRYRVDRFKLTSRSTGTD